jgi:leucyl aminopeptidase (aminopeptidase T)
VSRKESAVTSWANGGESLSIKDGAHAVMECLGVRESDSLLVVYNEPLRALADAVAAVSPTESVRVLEYPSQTRSGEEPPPAVGAALREATCAVMLTSYSISHTQARIDATEAGVRVASMPAITADTFARALTVDYQALRMRGDAVASRLTNADVCEITTPSGSDLKISLHGRLGRSDDGSLSASGAFGNLPAGEAYIAPVETEGAGTLVFDASLGSWGLLEEPLVIELRDGRAERIEGGAAAAWLAETLDSGGTSGRLIAEFAIGTNPEASLVGSILEDEKTLGTAHIAFGTSVGIGGTVQSSVHIDGVMRSPTVKLDGEVILDNGELLVHS